MTSPASIACASAENAEEMHPASALDKAALRRSMIAARKAVNAQQRTGWDTVLCDKVLAWWQAHPVGSLGVYWPIRQEPDLRPAYAVLAARGVQLALPVVVAADAALQFSAWTPGDALINDAMGVAVPASLELVACPQALLIPCLGYNAGNFRLGYGGGFYDRTLAAAPRPLAIGIAYCFSRADFAAASHDIALDCIITEAT